MTDGPWDDYKQPAQGPWNDFKAQEPTTADSVSDFGRQALHAVPEGIIGAVTLPYRALRGAAHEAGDRLRAQGYRSSIFPEELPEVPTESDGSYLPRPAPQTPAGGYGRAVGEMVGSTAVPVAGLIGKARSLAAVAPTNFVNRAIQGTGQAYMTAPARAAATDFAAASTAGVGQEVAKDQGFGPVGQAVGSVAGSLVPLAAANTIGRGVQAVQSARANASPYARVAKGLGDTSVDELANSVAVGAGRSQQDINRRVIDTLGEEMVNAGSDRQAAIAATLRRLETEGNVTADTAKKQLGRVIRSQSDSELMLGEYPAVARSNESTRFKKPENITDEAAGKMENTGTQQLIDYVANTGSMASSQNVKNAIGARAQNLKDSAENAVRSLSPNGKTIQDVAADAEIAATLARAEYGKVYNGSGGTMVDNGKLHQGLQDVVDKYAGVAAGRSGEQAQAVKSALEEFYVDLPSGQKVIMPSLQMAQDMRGSLRGIIQRNLRAGNDHIVNSLQPMYDDVTKVMQTASPAWAKANKRWADLKLDEVAADLGQSFAKGAGPKAREQLEQFKGLAPEAQDIVRVHFTQQLLDGIENASKLGGMKNLGELFTKAHTRTMIREILGDDAAVQMARFIRDANVMARSRDMLRGSPTQPRQQMQKEQDADINLVAAADNFDWKSWKAALMEKAVAFLRERRNKVIGKVVTTPIRDTPAVAEHLHRMRTADQIAQRYAQPMRSSPGVGGYAGEVIDQTNDRNRQP